jgi:hypothetical protein
LGFKKHLPPRHEDTKGRLRKFDGERWFETLSRLISSYTGRLSARLQGVRGGNYNARLLNVARRGGIHASGESPAFQIFVATIRNPGRNHRPASGEVFASPARRVA